MEKFTEFFNTLSHEELVELIKTITSDCITRETYFMILMKGAMIFCIMGILTGLFNLFMELAREKQWRRKSLEFISDEDIEIINEALEVRFTSENTERVIGRVIVNANEKHKALKRIRKEKWKKLWENFKGKGE